MTENGDPYENAIAERVNGILKTELITVITTQLKRHLHTYSHASPFITTDAGIAV
jgi:hypothetical protein